MKINNKNKINDKNNNNKNNDKTHSVNDDYYHKPTSYRSIFFISLIRDCAKTKAKGDGRKKIGTAKEKLLIFY